MILSGGRSEGRFLELLHPERLPGGRGVQVHSGVRHGDGEVVGGGVTEEQGLEGGRAALVSLEEHQVAAGAAERVSWLRRPCPRLLPATGVS